MRLHSDVKEISETFPCQETILSSQASCLQLTGGRSDMTLVGFLLQQHATYQLRHDE